MALELLPRISRAQSADVLSSQANIAGYKAVLLGAAALDLAYLAAGRYEGFWERGLNSWDMAAGLIIVREAGGFVSDFKGRDKALETGEIIAANSELHAPLRKLLSSAL